MEDVCLDTQIHISLMIPAILYVAWKTDCKAVCQNGTVQMYALMMDWCNTVEVLKEGSSRIHIMTGL